MMGNPRPLLRLRRAAVAAALLCAALAPAQAQWIDYRPVQPAELQRLITAVPSFGGIYFDFNTGEPRLNIVLTDPGQRERVLGALAGVEPYGELLQRTQYRVVGGTYSLSELERVQEALREQFGVRAEIDRFLNRVVVPTAAPADLLIWQSRLRTLGLPGDALVRAAQPLVSLEGTLTTPDQLARGDALDLTLRVRNTTGRPIAVNYGCPPPDVRILDARTLEAVEVVPTGATCQSVLNTALLQPGETFVPVRMTVDGLSALPPGSYIVRVDFYAQNATARAQRTIEITE